MYQEDKSSLCMNKVDKEDDCVQSGTQAHVFFPAILTCKLAK